MDAFPERLEVLHAQLPGRPLQAPDLDQIVREMTECNGTFYSIPSILGRLNRNVLTGRSPLLGLASSLISRRNSRRLAQIHEALWLTGQGTDTALPDGVGRSLIDMAKAAADTLRQMAATLKLRATWLFRQS